MATAVYAFFCAILLQFTATQQLKIINPAIISTDVNETCPSQEIVHQQINNDIRATLLSFRLNPECGDGLWQRIAYLNMSNPQEQCPPAWRLYNTNGVRACGRPVTSQPSCPGVIYTIGRQYHRVCGRIIGYQLGSNTGCILY